MRRVPILLLLAVSMLPDESKGFRCYASCEGVRCGNEYKGKIGVCYEHQTACIYEKKKDKLKRGCTDGLIASCTIRILGQCYALKAEMMDYFKMVINFCTSNETVFNETFVPGVTFVPPDAPGMPRSGNDTPPSGPNDQTGNPSDPQNQGQGVPPTNLDHPIPDPDAYNPYNMDEDYEGNMGPPKVPEIYPSDNKACLCTEELCNDEKFGDEDSGTSRMVAKSWLIFIYAIHSFLVGINTFYSFNIA